MSLAEQVEIAVRDSGLRAHFEGEPDEITAGRVENLDELISVASRFVSEEEGVSQLTAFLSHAVLEAGQQGAGAAGDAVQLMTLHSAKGLEFDTVFLAGMEEGLFPHSRSADDPARLEEERRLCYVGMTRARRTLCLTHAESRRLHGEVLPAIPSRFIAEIPPEHLEEVRLRGTVTRPLLHQAARPPQQAGGGLWVGQRVRHESFGEGVIIGAEGNGPRGRLHVNFARAGKKWLMVEYARLEPV